MTRMIACCLVLIGFLHSTSVWAWTVDIAIGDVNVELPSHEQHVAISHEILTVGSTINTGPGAKVILTDGASEICISGDSQFKIESEPGAEKKTGMLELLNGKLRAKLIRPENVSVYPYELKLRATVAGVRGTEFFAIVEPESDTICTTKGKVHVTAMDNPSESWDVPEGRTAVKQEGHAVVETKSDPVQVKKWKKETAREHGHAVSKKSPTPRAAAKAPHH